MQQAPVFLDVPGHDRRAEDREPQVEDPGAEAVPAGVLVLVEIAESFLNFQVVAQREAEQRVELAATPDVVATVPFFDTDTLVCMPLPFTPTTGLGRKLAV